MVHFSQLHWQQVFERQRVSLDTVLGETSCQVGLLIVYRLLNVGDELVKVVQRGLDQASSKLKFTLHVVEQDGAHKTLLIFVLENGGAKVSPCGHLRVNQVKLVLPEDNLKGIEPRQSSPR